MTDGPTPDVAGIQRQDVDAWAAEADAVATDGDPAMEEWAEGAMYPEGEGVADVRDMFRVELVHDFRPLPPRTPFSRRAANFFI